MEPLRDLDQDKDGEVKNETEIKTLDGMFDSRSEAKSRPRQDIEQDPRPR